MKAIAVDEAAIAAAGYIVIALEDVRRALARKGLNAPTVEQHFFVLGHGHLVTTKSARAATPLSSK